MSQNKEIHILTLLILNSPIILYLEKLKDIKGNNFKTQKSTGFE